LTKSFAVLIYFSGLVMIATSQLLLKAGMMRIAEAGALSRLDMARLALTMPAVWLGAAAVVAGTICWYVALMRLPLSFMMPMAALIAPSVSIAAWALFGDPLSGAKLAAIGLIAIGALWLGWLNA